MRKNKMMRAASVLLVAVMLTTCAISGTFAKYTTSATGSDTARVAKWGVTITANGSTFAKEYDKNGDTEIKSVVSTTDKVLAPGTKGEMVQMTISGTPEVAVTVTYEASVTVSGWVGNDSSTYYCPLEVKIGNDTLKGSDYNDGTEFANAIKGKIDAYTASYNAGDDLSTNNTSAPSVSWEWKFEGNDDAKDTYLGNITGKDVPTITLSITTTVTQVD